MARRKNNTAANLGYKSELWQMADALRGNLDTAEYKHVVLGLIFLKYIHSVFEEQPAKREVEPAQGTGELCALNAKRVIMRRYNAGAD
jgi:type I restriction-modification system DNA methylase subunit